MHRSTKQLTRRRTGAAVLSLLLMLAVIYRVIFEGQVLAGREVFRLFIPDNALLRDYLLQLDWPLWNPYQRMGQPFAASMQSQVFYPPRAITVWLLGPMVAITAMQVLHAALAAVGVAWFLQRLLNRWHAPWAAGAMFALSPMFTDLGMQQNVVDAAAWSGFLLGALHRQHWRGFAAFLGLSLLAASPETTLWQLFLCGLLAWWQRVSWVRLSLSTCLGFGLAALMLVPAAEFTGFSIRGAWTLNTAGWSMSWRQVIASFWPGFELPLPDYWGEDQHFVSNVFLGSLTVALAVFGACRGPRLTRVFSVGGALLLIFSMGRHAPVVRWLLEVPPFNFFRYPAKAYVGAALAASVLAGFGIDAAARFAQRSRVPRSRLLLVLLGAVVLFVGGMALLPALPLRAGARLGWPWPWFVLGSVALSRLVLPSTRNRGAIFAATVTAVCAAELLLARAVFVVPEYRSVEALQGPSHAVDHLPRPLMGRVSAPVEAYPETFPADAGDIIALSKTLLVPNRFVEERLETVNGYGAPEPERLERLAEVNSRGFFDLAGVTHFLTEDGGAPFADSAKVAELPGHVGLYSSTTALPRAFVVQRAVIATDEAALQAIEDEALGQPFRYTAFLAEGRPHDGVPCESRVVREAVGLRTLAYSVEACADGVLVMTHSYFPGWHARVDGVETPVVRADYVFCAVEVSAGRHRVELRYWPASFTAGLAISLLSLLALWHPFFARRRLVGAMAVEGAVNCS